MPPRAQTKALSVYLTFDPTCSSREPLLKLSHLVSNHPTIPLPRAILSASFVPIFIRAKLSAQVIPEAFFAVDTFFLMSAFLLSSTLLHKLETESLGRCAWMLKAYLHRYLRLTPTLAVVTFLTWKVLPLLGEGTGWWAQAAVKNDSCSK